MAPALASTAGGGNWKTYAPGKMPIGRLSLQLISVQVADRGLTGERTYLEGTIRGQFCRCQ